MVAPQLSFQSSKAQPITIYDSFDDCGTFLQLTQCTFCIAGSDVQFPYATSSNPYQNYEIVTCNFEMICPDGVQRSSCTWFRKMVVVCDGPNTVKSISNSFISITTNSMPNHCYYTETDYYPVQTVISNGKFDSYSFLWVFNLPWTSTDSYKSIVLSGAESDSQYTYTSLTTQSDLNSVLCDGYWANLNLIDAAIYYTEEILSTASFTYRGKGFQNYYNLTISPDTRLQNSDSIVGVALNGVFLFAGTSEYGYDAFFPKAYGNMVNPQAIPVDICLGSAYSQNTYRYHIFSPCIYDISLRSLSAPCSSDPECDSDIRKYAISKVPQQLQTMTPIGIAKDGRIIYGPFKSDGTLWQPCDVDVCNGVRSGNNYFYVATMFHPYMVGCFGPGNQGLGLSASCSSNPRLCSASGATALLNMMLAVTVIITTLFLSI